MAEIFTVEWRDGEECCGVDISLAKTDQINSLEFHARALIPALQSLQRAIEAKRNA